MPKKVIRSCNVKNERQYNDQKKNDKRRNNDLQTTTKKNKDQITRTPQMNVSEIRNKS